MAREILFKVHLTSCMKQNEEPPSLLLSSSVRHVNPRCLQNVLRMKKVAHEAKLSVSLILPYQEVFCDLLLNRCIATQNLFVWYHKEAKRCLSWLCHPCIWPPIDHGYKDQSKCVYMILYIYISIHSTRSICASTQLTCFWLSKIPLSWPIGDSLVHLEYIEKGSNKSHTAFCSKH